MGQVLVDSIYDMTGGEGQFAVLSATSTATNQNSWIAAMEQIIAGDAKYENLEWVVTVYGDDESQKSYDETESLMTNYPDLKVICCPTTVGILACAQAVQNSGSAIKVAGLGLPSEMNGYVGEGLPCPYMYLWNPIDVGPARRRENRKASGRSGPEAFRLRGGIQHGLCQSMAKNTTEFPAYIRSAYKY